MTRSTGSNRPSEGISETPSVRPSVREARDRMQPPPDSTQRVIRKSNNPLKKLWFWLLAGAAGAGLLALYFRNAGDRVPLSPFMSDASRSSRIIAPLGTETPRMTPGPRLPDVP